MMCKLCWFVRLVLFLSVCLTGLKLFNFAFNTACAVAVCHVNALRSDFVTVLPFKTKSRFCMVLIVLTLEMN